MASKSDLCEEGQRKFERVMSEFGNDKLTSSNGGKVTKRTQAVAIAMSEGRRACEGGSDG